jgi:hypothetical protein
MGVSAESGRVGERHGVSVPRVPRPRPPSTLVRVPTAWLYAPPLAQIGSRTPTGEYSKYA